MAKISFVLVFSLVLALPVLGQDDWKDLLGQGGFTPDSFDEAQKAFGSAAAQAAVTDYFGTGGGDDSSAQPEADEGEGEGSSLADFLDSDNNTSTGVSPAGSMVDSPVGAPEDLPSDDNVYDDDDSSPVGAEDSFSPAGAPLDSFDDEGTTEAPTNAPLEAHVDNAPTESPESAPTSAPTETPELAPTIEAPELAPTTNVAMETPELAPVQAPKGKEEEAPANAPSGEPDDKDDTEWVPAHPTEAPEAEPSDDVSYNES